MRHQIRYLLGLPLFILLLYSCAKEISYELPKPAEGSLQSKTDGDCLPKTAYGAYIADKSLIESNYVEVEVDVASAGPYFIYTDTVNGYCFNDSGVFKQKGINRIKLKGSGTPVSEGVDYFMVSFNSSFCMLPVTVLPAGSSGGPGQFSLQSNDGGCATFKINGTYNKGVALNGSNEVEAEVEVTSTGTYILGTNTVNGMTFSGAGTFGATGAQTIILTASGKPANTGEHTFTITDGTASCSFKVTITDATPPPPPDPSNKGDHFPLTANSWWSYDIIGAGIDTAKYSMDGTATMGGNKYQKIKVAYEDGDVENEYYRKSGNDYYFYGNADAFSFIGLDDAQQVGIIFMKENLSKGTKWNSIEYTGKASGQNVKIKYNFECIEDNTTLTLNGAEFKNVYKIVITSYVNLLGTGFVPELVTECYYAKGIGKIYQKSAYNNSTYSEQAIRTWVVL